jgi:hypothetical protein
MPLYRDMAFCLCKPFVEWLIGDPFHPVSLTSAWMDTNWSCGESLGRLNVRSGVPPSSRVSPCSRGAPSRRVAVEKEPKIPIWLKANTGRSCPCRACCQVYRKVQRLGIGLAC